MNLYSELLESMRFEELENALSILTLNEKEEVLNHLAYNSLSDVANPLVYTFLNSILIKKESANIHFLISKVMGLTLNFLPKAELIGLYHGLRASELSPNDMDIKEYLIYYNHIPEKVLSDDDAVKLALEIVKSRPDSKVAQITLSKISHSN
jgi:hypothetical protein